MNGEEGKREKERGRKRTPEKPHWLMDGGAPSCREQLEDQNEVRMVFSRKTGIRTEVQILSLRKKRHSKHGSNREQEGEWFEKIHL